MENTEKLLILRVSESDIKLRRLYREHEELEGRLLKLGRKGFLTPNEQMEQRRLKKQKLFGVDRMMEILQAHRLVAAA